MSTYQTAESSNFRAAPRGFSDNEFETLFKDGVVVLKERLSGEEIEAYLKVIDECIATGSAYSSKKTHRLTNIVRSHSLLTNLIDHERHVGYAYDFYGEQLRLVQSDLFVRPPGGVVNKWHIDGPRVVPYHLFSPRLPLKLRVGYYLTDLPHAGMGNFVYLPGSHLEEGRESIERTEALSSHADSAPSERTLCCKAGTITVAFGHVWHRVDANVSDVTRKTIFLSYTPSWVSGYHPVDPIWTDRLTREQRIIMRPYEDDWEAYSRPPAEDLPLYLDRESFRDADPGTNFAAERHKWRRMTGVEAYWQRRDLADGA